MKTGNKSFRLIKQALFAVAAMVALTHCSSGSSGSTTATSANYVSGAYCLNSAGTVIGLASTCTTATSTTGYYVSGAYCLNSAGTVVGAASLCTTLNGTTTTAYGTTSCVGTYIYTGNGTAQLISCNGSNCSGARLYTYPAEQIVYCQ